MTEVQNITLATGESVPSTDPAWRDECFKRWERVLQCRGHDTALATGLKALRPQGVVVDLGFYQGGAGAVRLGEEFHHDGLSVVCAQISRVPRGMAPAWPRCSKPRAPCRPDRHCRATCGCCWPTAKKPGCSVRKPSSTNPNSPASPRW